MRLGGDNVLKIQIYKKRNNLTPYIFIFPALALISFIVVFPISNCFFISLLKWDLRYISRTFIGLENYKNILFSENFLKVLITTVIWTVVGVSLQMIIGLILANFVQRKKHGAKVLQVLFLLPWVIPGIVVSIIWSWMLQADLGIINNVLMQIGLIKEPILWLSDKKLALGSVIAVNTWKAFPFWFLMLYAGLLSLPSELLEAAKIDGANELQLFWYIKIPHLMPVIAATGVVTTIWTLNYFDLIYVMTRGGPGTSTSTLPIYTYRLGFQFFKFGESAAMAIISLVVIVLLCIPYIKMMMPSLGKKGTL